MIPITGNIYRNNELRQTVYPLMNIIGQQNLTQTHKINEVTEALKTLLSQYAENNQQQLKEITEKENAIGKGLS